MKSHLCLAPLLALALAAPARLATAEEMVAGGHVYGAGAAGMAVDAQGGAVVYGAQGAEMMADGMGGMGTNWHAGYHHVAWGQPVALVVPPTANYQTNWGWGIGNTRITPIYPQFQGPTTVVPSQYRYGRTLPTPYYVSDTLQIGVYYIRGPW